MNPTSVIVRDANPLDLPALALVASQAMWTDSYHVASKMSTSCEDHIRYHRDKLGANMEDPTHRVLVAADGRGEVVGCLVWSTQPGKESEGVGHVKLRYPKGSDEHCIHEYSDEKEMWRLEVLKRYGGHVRVETVVVAPGAQSTGVGSALLKEPLRIAMASKQRLFLETTAEALGFYQAFAKARGLRIKVHEPGIPVRSEVPMAIIKAEIL